MRVSRYVFQTEKKGRLVPCKTDKPLSSRDVLVRLRECWGILNPRRPRELTQEDVELISFNFQLAALYQEVRELERDGCCGHIGFGNQSEGSGEPDGGDEDEKWYYAEVYCDKT